MRENVLYCGVIVPACESADGETATEVFVTEYANGFLLWRNSHDEGRKIVRWGCDRDELIEQAVQMAHQERKAEQRARTPSRR